MTAVSARGVTSVLAKRRRFSRWRRLPPVYRVGEHKLPSAKAEPQRLIIYLPEEILDAAEAQAAKAGVDTIQDYCAELLRRAIEMERVREQVADVEAKRGPLEGLHEIANDPQYLAEWSAQSDARERPVFILPTVEEDRGAPDVTSPIETTAEMLVPLSELEISQLEQSTPDLKPAAPPPLSDAARIVIHHAGQGREDPQAFLSCLRRGESLAGADVTELVRALIDLERESRDARQLDREVVFALHRLAYEGQILHTDAWPGTFDEWTVDTLRGVQEAVDRILSGRDIRYFSTDSPSEQPS